jgi:hypothetical protein
MPVPDEVVFGPGDQTEALSSGDVRSLRDDCARIDALKRRLDTFFIRQVDELGKSEAGEAKSIRRSLSHY